jgi:hypothetical protein
MPKKFKKRKTITLHLTLDSEGNGLVVFPDGVLEDLGWGLDDDLTLTPVVTNEIKSIMVENTTITAKVKTTEK